MLGIGPSLTGQAARRAAGGGIDAAHAIVSVANNGTGSCRFTTEAAHGLSGTEQVAVTGNSVSGYNTTHQLIPNDLPGNEFDTEAAYTADGTGGTWTLA